MLRRRRKPGREARLRDVGKIIAQNTISIDHLSESALVIDVVKNGYECVHEPTGPTTDVTPVEMHRFSAIEFKLELCRGAVSRGWQYGESRAYIYGEETAKAVRKVAWTVDSGFENLIEWVLAGGHLFGCNVGALVQIVMAVKPSQPTQPARSREDP